MIDTTLANVRSRILLWVGHIAHSQPEFAQMDIEVDRLAREIIAEVRKGQANPNALADELECWIESREGYEAAVVWKSLVHKAIAALRAQSTAPVPLGAPTDAEVDKAVGVMEKMAGTCRDDKVWVRAALNAFIAERGIGAEATSPTRSTIDDLRTLASIIQQLADPIDDDADFERWLDTEALFPFTDCHNCEGDVSTPRKWITHVCADDIAARGKGEQT